MTDTKAPRMKRGLPLDPESESWHKLPWRKFEQHVYRIQKRIFRAEQRGNVRAVHKLQKLLMRVQSSATDSCPAGDAGESGQENRRDRRGQIGSPQTTVGNG
jgi:hypothetical protein